MSAYVIATYDIVDKDGYEGYVPGVLPLLEKHSAEILAADFDAKTLEGEKRHVHVILRFESEEAAHRWYDDPAYEKVKKIRLDSCANCSVAVAKQFEPPSS